jgi:hypothetical protein
METKHKMERFRIGLYERDQGKIKIEECLWGIEKNGKGFVIE